MEERSTSTTQEEPTQRARQAVYASMNSRQAGAPFSVMHFNDALRSCAGTEGTMSNAPQVQEINVLVGINFLTEHETYLCAWVFVAGEGDDCIGRTWRFGRHPGERAFTKRRGTNLDVHHLSALFQRPGASFRKLLASSRATGRTGRRADRVVEGAEGSLERKMRQHCTCSCSGEMG